jgi:hypothetical protein
VVSADAKAWTHADRYMCAAPSETPDIVNTTANATSALLSGNS